MRKMAWVLAGVALALVCDCSDVWAQGADVTANRLYVDSTAGDAVDVAGGIVLGINLAAEDGGVPETAVILVNGTVCPPPLVVFPTTIPGLGSLIACLYAPEGASQLGAAQLGSATLQ